MSESIEIYIPRWVRRLRLDAGCKLTLEVLWSLAARPCTGCVVVFASVASVADGTGDPERTVQDRLAKLRAAGWIRRAHAHGSDAWELTWLVPFDVQIGIRGHVYALEFSNGVVKIGRSSDPESRVGQHAEDAGHFGLTVLRKWASPEVDDSDRIERAMISHLSAAWPSSGRGIEWFIGGFDEAVACADGLISEVVE